MGRRREGSGGGFVHALVGVALAATAVAPAARAASFAVNTADDADDGACDFAHCTLREAIHAANIIEGFDQISFLIPPFDGRVVTIRLLDPLPPLADPAGVALTGLSQPGSSANSSPFELNSVLLIEIDGALAGIEAAGLVLGAGSASLEGVIVNGFAASGILVEGGTDHQIADCQVGIDAARLRPAANGGDGITVRAPGTRIVHNVVGANRGDGIRVEDGGSALLDGNVIGAFFDGVEAFGNEGNGVSVSGAGSEIGSTAPEAGFPPSVIRFNGGAGVLFGGPGARDNVLRGHVITENRSHGVLIEDGAADNFVGEAGLVVAASNVILGNGGNGVRVAASAGSPNRVVPARAVDNTGIPIDLEGGVEDGAGVTANDALDADDGPNGLQNAPVLLSAATFGTSGAARVSARFSGRPGQTLLPVFYVGSRCDPSGFGGGDAGAQVVQVVLGEDGEAPVVDVQILARAGDVVAALSVDTEGNSSEYSNCIGVAAGPTPTPRPTFTPTATMATTPTAVVATPASTPTRSPGGATPTGSPGGATPTATPTVELPLGDANCDGMRNAADVVSVISQLSEGRLECRADVTGDERVDGADLAALLAAIYAP